MCVQICELCIYAPYVYYVRLCVYMLVICWCVYVYVYVNYVCVYVCTCVYV